MIDQDLIIRSDSSVIIENFRVSIFNDLETGRKAGIDLSIFMSQIVTVLCHGIFSIINNLERNPFVDNTQLPIRQSKEVSDFLDVLKYNVGGVYTFIEKEINDGLHLRHVPGRIESIGAIRYCDLYLLEYDILKYALKLKVVKLEGGIGEENEIILNYFNKLMARADEY